MSVFAALFRHQEVIGNRDSVAGVYVQRSSVFLPRRLAHSSEGLFSLLRHTDDTANQRVSCFMSLWKKNTKKCVFPNMLRNRAWSSHFYLEHWKTVEHLPLVYWIIQGTSVIIGCMWCGCIVYLYMWCLIMATFDSQGTTISLFMRLLSVFLQDITMRVLHKWLCPYSPYTDWNKKENPAHSLLLSPTWHALNICTFLDLWLVESNNVRMNITWVWKTK